MLDLNDLYTVEAHEAGAEMEILHPKDGSRTGIFLSLLGADSRKYRKADAESQKRLMNAKEEDVTAEFVESERIEKMVAITTGWRGAQRQDEDIPFTADAVRELYRESPPVLEQAYRFILNRANYYRD